MKLRYFFVRYFAVESMQHLQNQRFKCVFDNVFESCTSLLHSYFNFFYVINIVMIAFIGNTYTAIITFILRFFVKIIHLHVSEFTLVF